MSQTSDEFGIQLPANARIASMEFRDRDLGVHLDDGGSERIVTASNITAIHGATILREGVHPAPSDSPGIIERTLRPETVAVTEATQYVIAMRVMSVGELWYLVADTFNYRKTLGADAGYLLDQNLRTLLDKLTSFAPQAVQDGFVTALLADLPLPPPVGSLLEFFKVVAR